MNDFAYFHVLERNHDLYRFKHFPVKVTDLDLFDHVYMIPVKLSRSANNI